MGIARRLPYGLTSSMARFLNQAPYASPTAAFSEQRRRVFVAATNLRLGAELHEDCADQSADREAFLLNLSIVIRSNHGTFSSFIYLHPR